MTNQHKTVLAQKDEVIALKDRALTRYLVDAAATAALAAAKGSTALLMPHVRAAVKVVQDGDEYAVRIVGKDGAPRVNSKGEFLTIEDLVSEMRQSEEYGRAFDASGTTGGGAQGGGGSGPKTMKQSAFDALSPKERAKRIAEGYSLTS